MRAQVEALLSLREEDWGEYAFRRDPLYGKLPAAQRRELAAQAAQTGRQQAKVLCERLGQATPREYARRLGLHVHDEEESSTLDLVTFAQFRAPDNITLFLRPIRDAAALLEQEKLHDLLEHVDIAELLIAHELYHWLEEQTPSLFTRAHKITLWRLGPFSYTSGLLCLGEIGAMAFAGSLLGLSYSPYVFDVLLLWRQNPQQAQALYEAILQCKGD